MDKIIAAYLETHRDHARFARFLRDIDPVCAKKHAFSALTALGHVQFVLGVPVSVARISELAKTPLGDA